MIAEKLKKSILQAAMEGRLTRQLLEDGESQRLIDAISSYKKRLKSEGHIKNSTVTLLSNQDEILFDIPSNWSWVRLGDITDYGVGKQVQKNNIESNALIIELEDIEKESNKLIKKVRDRKPGSSKNRFYKHDVLYGKLRPYLNKCIVADEDGYCSTEIIPFRGYESISSKYLMYYMISPIINSYINSITHGMDMPRLGTTKAVNLPIPLPPLAEQKRIVEKLDEILPIIDSLEKDESKLKDLMQQFPNSMRVSVLKAAIQGNLTERHIDDDDPQNLFSKPIPNDNFEFPFDVPENWIWVDFDSVIKSLGTKKYQILASEVKIEGKHPVVSQSQNFIDGYSDLSDKLFKVNEPIIIFGDHTKNIKLIDFDFIVGADGTKLLLVNNSNTRFIYYVLMYYINALETRNYGRHFKLLSSKLIPVPPLAEQSRIVDKLDRLLPIIEKLNNEQL